MVTFNSFKTQKGKDFVEIYDGASKQLITKLSGVYSKALSFTSESNSIDVRFISDGSENSEGFSASFKQVSKYSVCEMSCVDPLSWRQVVYH